MKKITGFAVSCLFVFLTAIALWGCIKDKTTKTYTIQRPVYKPLSEVLAAINGKASEPVQSAGKLYIKGNYIFLNEVDKGIHVIDNTNPARPVQAAFLAIPGNRDIAVKGNILYADMYASLLAIDISDIHHTVVTKNISKFFTNRNIIYPVQSDTNLVIADWIKKDTTVNAGESNWLVFSNCVNCSQFSSTADALKAAPANGTAGSMAAMVLLNDYLYALTESSTVGIVSLSNAASPTKAGSLNPGFSLETIYPFKDKLFLGSSVGMYIVDVSDPVHPKQVGQFVHTRSCDPVVTDGTNAYVTLQGGSRCGGTSNELDVLDVQNVLKPVLLKTYPLTKPTGLSKDGNLLFVCDGSAGVKVYDAANAYDLKLLKQIKCDDPYDVIAGGNRALVVTKNGLIQYDYSDLNSIKLLSIFSTRL